MNKIIESNLELARVELLDIGLRGNTLLHFKQGAKTLEVVDEVSREIFRILVEQQKAMTFAPVPDELVDEGDQVDDAQPLPALLEEKFGDNRHTDNKLQTKHTADKLDKRLLKISNEASTYYQEQGVDILYIALGFLTWYEDKNSDKVRKAPLVLVPVALERSTAKERFKVRYTQADLGPNLSLDAKLKMEFGLQLPEFSEELDIESYFSEIAEIIKNQPRWKVNENEIGLGFFSFGKFQMYQDLDPANWAEKINLGDHPILSGLLGEGFDGGSSSEGTLEGLNGSKVSHELADLHFVKDADSSQTEAVMTVMQGSNLVIQGPPGTGKSQTITNIISQSLADGKRILFVAEKMAALEVVKRRLDECHLGEAVLELHSHKSNKKTVLEEIKRTLELGVPNVGDRNQEKSRHARLREQLDAYCSDVNAAVLNSGVSYIDALGHYLKLKKSAGDYTMPELDFEKMESWSQAEFNEACAHIRELVNHLEEMGVPANNIFADSKLEDFSPFEQNQIVSLLANAISLLEHCEKEGKSLAEEMDLPTPNTLADIQSIHRAATRALQAPHLDGVKLTTDDWQRRRDQIQSLLDAGSEITRIHNKRSGQLIDQAWQADLLNVRQVYKTTGQKWWRFLSSDFWQAKRELQGLMKEDLPGETSECIALIDDILACQTQTTKFQKYEHIGEELFGAQWQAEESDWDVLRRITAWVIGVYEEVGRGDLPQGLLRFLEGGNSLNSWEPRLKDLNEKRKLLEAQLTDVMQRLATQVPGHTETAIDNLPLPDLASSLNSWYHKIDDLYLMIRYNRLVNSLSKKGFDQIAGLSYKWEYPPELLLTTFKVAWYGGLVNAAYTERTTLRQFDRISQENVINEFRQLDSHLFYHAQESLVGKLHDQMPQANTGAGEMAIIRKEINRRRRHMPIRKLIAQAGRAIQQIKPVFMMSPMSVATYLEQGAVEFDLVVFDEASQVKVVDAIGPILRGQQVVVVGDTKQMPPTDFFGKAVELNDEEAEESQTADIESILSMFLSKGVSEKMLRWHYRSRHDSLISVSNQEFYDGKLMIFPSPGVNPEAKGLSFNYLPETSYDRGGSRTNVGEARAVAEAVMGHVRKCPDLTLGVVAFSTAQRDAILLEVERLRRQNPDCEHFFNNDNLEGFFVKNLENVQGDERDIIYISIGYGKMASGKTTGNFGPLNRDGGERRLNVLITRARLGMEVFCNFRADDLKTTDASSFGVRALKSFLKFAESGELENRRETGKDTDSPFEDEVISAIRSLGYDLEPQVGSAGFFIDIAVRDPEKPGRYILAVECDGASYHSSASARDRDRLRQSVLEGLGWRFHRIWSTDWFRNPHKETERLKDSIEAAIVYFRQLDANEQPVNEKEQAPEMPEQKIERTVVTETVVPVNRAYAVADGPFGIPHRAEIHELSLGEVAGAISKVVEVEAPIHIKEAARRITEAAGFTKVGHRILAHVKKAVTKGHKQQVFYYENEFIYLDSSKPVMVRDRSALPPSSRSIELVSNTEIAHALLQVVEMSFSISRQDAISEALSLIGFKRATEKVRDNFEDVFTTLIKEGKLQFQGEIVSLVEK
jgi:very-short-patch-repair endonuclease